jgi:tRNA A-37 threonylcarbamoyl transferase component Bud32
MIKIVKELKGFSGNRIFLVDRNNQLLIRKRGNVVRNIERMLALADNYPLPKIYSYSDTRLDMEYVHGLDIRSYLKINSYENLLAFIVDILNNFKKDSIEKDYSTVYKNKLLNIKLDGLGFTREELFNRLPKILPSSTYHGDMTFENIIYNTNMGKFVLIDPATIEYDSYIFDIAKMRQDLHCGWFIRNDRIMVDVKLKHIQQQLFINYPESNDDYLLILMLLRVYNHATPGSFEHKFLTERIKSLWK